MGSLLDEKVRVTIYLEVHPESVEVVKQTLEEQLLWFQSVDIPVVLVDGGLVVERILHARKGSTEDEIAIERGEASNDMEYGTQEEEVVEEQVEEQDGHDALLRRYQVWRESGQQSFRSLFEGTATVALSSQLMGGNGSSDDEFEPTELKRPRPRPRRRR